MNKIYYKKIAFIYNPYSNKGNGNIIFNKTIKPLINELLSEREIIIKETTKTGDAIELTKKLLNENYNLVVACGGDGTINEVVNGLIDYRTNKSLGTLAIIPIGTGNDFSRTINFTNKDNDVNYREIIETIKYGLTTYIDIGQVSSCNSHRYWINNCGVGISGEIVNVINNSYFTWIPKNWIFKLHTLYQNLIYTNKEIKYIVNNTNSFITKCQAIIVSNGKYFGNGMCGSPDALINDKILNYGVLGDIGILDMYNILPSLYNGNKITHPKIKLDTCFKIDCIPLNKNDIIKIETDGELFDNAPCSISILENILPLIIKNK